MILRPIWSSLVLCLAATCAHAQAWPTKQPLRVIVTNTAGSGVDVTTRIVLEQVSRQIGQTIVVENRPGGANTIGIAAVAKAEPDGYTILATTSALTITPHTHRNLPYDPMRDLHAVIPLGNITNVMLTQAGRFKSPQELVIAAKAKADALSYASMGPGSTGHLSAERFRLSAGFSAVHVPFKGTLDAVREIAAGRVDFFFTPVLAALALIREGKADALVISSSSRSSILPSVPTTTEAGFANSTYNFWIGLFLPAGTPQSIVDRLHEECAKALQLHSVKERLVALGGEPMNMTPAQFQAYLQSEMEINAALVKAAGIKPE
jgi:tripartite-type tricarboxylate transporter receptor subunit TctC